MLNKFIFPNGLYKENGRCLETLLSGAHPIQDMILQSGGGKIRIFQAIPDFWKNFKLQYWLAGGAFEVSPKLPGGKTEFIIIKSLAGAPCLLCTSMKNPSVFKMERR